jgi:DNA polymerase III delta prime subunit
MSFTFTKAERSKQKLRLAIEGPSGSGKTEGALALARGLVGPAGRIAVLDTENGSAALYSDRYEFDHGIIGPPYLTKKYLEGMAAAAKAGYDALIVDSISPQWDGTGGILQRKDEADSLPGANRFTNWGPFSKEHEAFRAAILNFPKHIIVTMRSKMAYTQTERDGRKKVEKLGLQPQQRDGLEYEFTLVLSVGMDHRAIASKDRTALFEVEAGGTPAPVDLRDPDVVDRLRDWLDSGKEPEPVPVDIVPFGAHAGKRVSEIPEEDLAKLITWASNPGRRDQYGDLLVAALQAAEAHASNGNGHPVE